MQIRITTRVTMPLDRVIERFDRDFFLKLMPPFPPVRLLRFDGIRTGDEVHLELLMPPLKPQLWIGRIIEYQRTADELVFIDVGATLPFFLSSWHHRHIMKSVAGGTSITDAITFQSSWRVFDFLLYPVMWCQFYYRKPIYRRLLRGTS